MFTKKLKKRLLFISLVGLVFFRYFSAQPHYSNGQRLRITARVLEEPVQYGYSQSLSLRGLKIYLPLFPEISYGDKIVVEGEVQKGELINPKLIAVGENQNFLLKLRLRLITFYRIVLPEPHASLVAGITLGSKSEIPTDFWQTLKNTGVAHVLVASGMNVTLLAGFLVSLLTAFWPRRKALPLVLVATWLYSLMTGFDAPIIRAAIMASLTFTAQFLGKLASAWRVLVITALMMLLIKPLWLTDLGFILSFVATASLLLFEKSIRERLPALPKVLREGFSTSLAAQIGVTPILFVTFGQFNILSPLVNALVLWTVPLIMVTAGVGGFVGLVAPALGKLVLYLSYPLTWWFIKIVSIF